MLRELFDIALHEDFVHGLGRASGLRICTYDNGGELITARGPTTDFARLTGWTLSQIPPGMRLTRVPAHDPPGGVLFVLDRGVWYVAAPVYVDEQQAGWVAVGEFREDDPKQMSWQDIPALAAITEAWQRLPRLDRSGGSHAVITARWGARMLAEWCQRELRLLAATEEAALVGDIAELLTGRDDLQVILDRIVADTARVMKCRYCSLRLFDSETDELRIQAVHNLPERYLRKGAIFRSQNPIDDEALRGRLVYVEDVTSDPRVQFSQEMEELGIVSQLTAGMIYQGQPIGVLRVYTERRRRFRATQRNLLRAVAHQAATAIVHARLIEQRLRAAENERQLRVASELQARMMRMAPPYRRGLSTATAYHPTSHLGGDFCDVFTLGDGRVAVVVADVVGKGVPAALLSASIRGALYAIASSGSDLGEIVTRLNRQICMETLSHEFVTLLLVAVDVERCRLGYCNGGHEPLLLLRDGEIRTLSDNGMVLGFSDEERYVEQGVDLRPGDLLLLYTDGATEAIDFADEQFGRERLFASVVRYGHLAVDQVLHNITWDIRRFVGLADQTDDLTMVGVKLARS